MKMLMITGKKSTIKRFVGAAALLFAVSITLSCGLPVCAEETAAFSTESSSSALYTPADEEYPELLEGNLTREELEFVLAHISAFWTSEGAEPLNTVVNTMCQLSMRTGSNFITSVGGPDGAYRYGFSLTDVNRLISVFTDFQYSAENSGNQSDSLYVEGDTLWTIGPEPSSEKAVITSALCSGSQLLLHFTYSITGSDGESSAPIERSAVFEKTENGLFRITEIVSAADLDTSSWDPEASGQASEKVSSDTTAADNSDTGTSDNASSGNAAGAGSISGESLYAAYSQILDNFEAGSLDAEFQFFAEGMDAYCDTEGRFYAVEDVNADGVPELLISWMFYDPYLGAYDTLVYTASGDNAVQIGEVNANNIALPADGNGLYGVFISRGTGMITFDRYSSANEGWTYISQDFSFRMDDTDGSGASFVADNPYVVWTEVADRSTLEGLSAMQ